MAEEKNMTVATEEKTEATAPKTENQYLLKLNRPYVFEGKEYAEIDLAGLDKLTVQDAINAQRQLFNEREPAAMLLCETTTAFVRILAAKATGLPIEFFKLAPRGVSRRIYGMVMGYMNVDRVLVLLSQGYPQVMGRLDTRYSPVRRSTPIKSKLSMSFPLDLHVLSL